MEIDKRHLVTLALGALLAAGCGGAPNTGRFSIGGVQRHEGCLEAMFPFEPSFFAARNRIDSVGLFMQSSAEVTQRADLVYIEVFEADEARSNPGGSFSFGYPTRSSSPVRVEIDTQESCPKRGLHLAVEGSVRFDEFGTASGDRMVGALTDGTVLDATNGEVVAESLTGEWDFSVEITAPHRNWPTERDEYPTDP